MAAGHAQATASAPSPESDPVGATPCHSHSTVPQNTGDQCADCGAHFFLTSTTSGVSTLTAAGTVFSTVDFFIHPASALEASSLACHSELAPHALPLPRYLSLSVLRL